MAGWRSGNDIASGAGSLGLHFRADQIGHKVANGSLPLDVFSEFEAVLPRR